MDKAMERAMAEVDRKIERAKFIFIIVVFVCFATAGLLIVKYENEYPPEDDLVYEEFTFIRYEYGKNKSRYCRIYVNECEKPLEITSIDIRRIDEAVLKGIRPGDSIRVCTNGEGRIAIFIRSALHEGKPILAYEDYLATHTANDQIRVVLGWIFFAISGLVITSQSSQYAVSGKCARIYSRFSPDRPTVEDIAHEIRQMRKKQKRTGDISMKRHQLLISLIPILGSFFYSFYLFLMDRQKFPKAFLATLSGMGSFLALYGSFAAICNATSIDLIAYEWLVYLMLALSGMIWNVVYFSLLNKISK